MSNNPDVVTIQVRDKPFTLTRNQILYDSPNYLSTSLLLEDGEKDPTKSGPKAFRLTISSRPDIFSLIVDYLSGYQLFPLSQSNCPIGMTVEQTRMNLLHDAQVLELTKLEEELLRIKTDEEELEKQKKIDEEEASKERSIPVKDVTDGAKENGLMQLMGFPDGCRVLLLSDVGISFRYKNFDYNTCQARSVVKVHFGPTHSNFISELLEGFIPLSNPHSSDTDAFYLSAETNLNLPHRSISMTSSLLHNQSLSFTLEEYFLRLGKFHSEQSEPGPNDSLSRLALGSGLSSSSDGRKLLNVTQRHIGDVTYLDIVASKACLVFEEVTAPPAGTSSLSSRKPPKPVIVSSTLPTTTAMVQRSYIHNSRQATSDPGPTSMKWKFLDVIAVRGEPAGEKVDRLLDL